MKDYNAGDEVDIKFTSVSSGIPTALSAGEVKVYKDNLTSNESSAGVVLTASFDSITGLNHVRIPTTAATTFYVDGSKYQAILTAGTVDGNSVAGYVIGEFSIRYGTVDDIADGTTMLSTDADDLIASTTLIQAESTASAVVLDGVAAGTTMLSTDMDDLIATTTAIFAESTATAAVVDGIAAGTTMLSTDLDDVIADIAALNDPSAAAIADAVWDEDATAHQTAGTFGQAIGDPTTTTTAHTIYDVLVGDAAGANLAVDIAALAAGTTMLSTDMDDLIATTTSILAESTATAVVVDGIAAGTTMLSTDADDLIASTTLIQAESTATAVVVDGIAAGTTMLSTDLDDLIATTTAIAGETTGIVANIWAEAMAELSTAMPAAPSYGDVLAFQHMAAWNLHVTTGSSGYDLIYNDAGAQVFQAAVSQPTTDSFQRAQWTTG